MINLLMVCPALGSGGIEKLISQWEPEARTNGIRFVFGVFSEGGALYDYYKRNGYKIYHLTQVKDAGLAAFNKQIKGIVEKEEIEIIHLNAGTLSWLTLRAAKKAGVRSRIAHAHTNLYNLPRNKAIATLMLPVIRTLNRKYSTQQIGCSQEACDYCFGKSDKNYVIHNGIDVDKFLYSEEKRITIRNELGIPLDAPVLGFVGRLSEQKNPFFALDIYEALLKKMPQTEMLFVGDGELREDLKKSVDAKELKHVHFVGTKQEVAGYYSAMDFSIMPSLYEGLPIVAVEAQAASLRLLVSTNVPQEVAITDLVERMNLKDSVDLWADKLKDMFMRRNRQKSYLTELIKNGYNREDSVNSMIKLYLAEISFIHEVRK